MANIEVRINCALKKPLYLADKAKTLLLSSRNVKSQRDENVQDLNFCIITEIQCERVWCHWSDHYNRMQFS